MAGGFWKSLYAPDQPIARSFWENAAIFGANFLLGAATFGLANLAVGPVGAAAIIWRVFQAIGNVSSGKDALDGILNLGEMLRDAALGAVLAWAIDGTQGLNNFGLVGNGLYRIFKGNKLYQNRLTTARIKSQKYRSSADPVVQAIS